MHRVLECPNGSCRRTEVGRRSAVETAERPGYGREGIRRALVERIRKQIRAGTYETPGRIDIATDRVLERLLARYGR